MKGLGVYCHCVEAEFVTLFGPRAMGPSPSEAQRLIMYSEYYIINGGAGGGLTIPPKMKK